MRTRAHEVPAHARAIQRNALFNRVVARRRCPRDVEIHCWLDPVDAVPPPSGKFSAIGRAPHVGIAEDFARELEVSAVQTIVNAENEMRTVILENLQIISATEGDRTFIEQAE